MYAPVLKPLLVTGVADTSVGAATAPVSACEDWIGNATVKGVSGCFQHYPRNCGFNGLTMLFLTILAVSANRTGSLLHCPECSFFGCLRMCLFKRGNKHCLTKIKKRQ